MSISSPSLQPDVKPALANDSSCTALRLSHLIMTLFFAYATIVQINDPDSAFWMGLYGTACVASLSSFIKPELNMFAKWVALLLAASTTTLLGLRYKQEQRYLDLSPRTEIGRENGGTSIVLFWSIVMCVTSSSRRLQTPLSTWAVLGAALALAASVYIIPKWHLQPKDTIDHCTGIGISVPSQS